MQNDGNEPLIEMLFRNGTLTVVAILLSFSLTFVTQWANNPIPWELADLPTLILLSAGIVCQGTALAMLLRHDSLKKRVYDRAGLTFMTGVTLTGAGVISAIVVDFIQLVS